MDCPRHEPARDGTPERFTMGWTRAGGGPGQQVHNLYHKDAHFAYFFPETDTFANAQGHDLGKTISLEEMKLCVVLDSGELDPNNKQIVDYYFEPSCVDDTDLPVVVFNFNNTLMTGRWNGSSWSYTTVIEQVPQNQFNDSSVGPA